MDESSYEIYGNYNSETASQLHISVDRCVNSTKNNYGCASLEEINEFLRDKYILVFYNEINFNHT